MLSNVAKNKNVFSAKRFTVEERQLEISYHIYKQENKVGLK